MEVYIELLTLMELTDLLDFNLISKVLTLHVLIFACVDLIYGKTFYFSLFFVNYFPRKYPSE